MDITKIQLMSNVQIYSSNLRFAQMLYTLEASALQINMLLIVQVQLAERKNRATLLASNKELF